jgi:hypothetical protein
MQSAVKLPFALPDCMFGGFVCRVAKFSGVHSLDLHFPGTFGSHQCEIHFVGLKGEYSEVRQQPAAVATAITQFVLLPSQHIVSLGCYLDLGTGFDTAVQLPAMWHSRTGARKCF